MKFVFSLFIPLMFMVAPAGADHHKGGGPVCEAPKAAAQVPDGASASREEMLDAKDGVQSYVRRGEIYLDCMTDKIEQVRKQIETAVTDETSEKTEAQQAAENEYRMLVKAHDEVVSEMQRLANAFNEALQAYNAED